jgi:hypothetical protein
MTTFDPTKTSLENSSTKSSKERFNCPTSSVDGPWPVLPDFAAGAVQELESADAAADEILLLNLAGVRGFLSCRP